MYTACAWAPVSVPRSLWTLLRIRDRSDAIHSSFGFSALAQRRCGIERLHKTPCSSDISSPWASERCDLHQRHSSGVTSESSMPNPRTSNRTYFFVQVYDKTVGKQQWTRPEIVTCRGKHVSTQKPYSSNLSTLCCKKPYSSNLGTVCCNTGCVHILQIRCQRGRPPCVFIAVTPHRIPLLSVGT